MIDFRSDTVTQPTPNMKAAMTEAPLGDDVFGDDPTVNALEAKAAGMFGKQAALFCPSGTMTNQIAIKVHTRPGDEVICHELSHIYNYEGGGIAMNSGCSVRLLSGNRGRFIAQDVIDSINPDDPHFPITRLVSLENTSNKGGGAIWNSKDIQDIHATCKEHNLSLHLDGARLFNALVETNESTLDVGNSVDTISICLSKGLGCPVGSLLIGNKDFIKQSRRVRKVFGGGMRQAGFLAAAGIYALDHHVQRLKEDHENARELARSLETTDWVSNVVDVDTNIVVAELENASRVQETLDQLSDLGIQAVAFGAGKIRFVTHLGISNSDIDRCAELFKKVK